MKNSDEHFINIALDEAKKASWPFGAVVVRNGEILAQAGAGDGKDALVDPTAHAETNAIRRACEKINSSDLSGATLYASCEPCVLCFGAAWYANIRKIVYGASLKDTEKFSHAWGGDLGFPHDHIAETQVEVTGGMMRDDVMKMYSTHPRIIK